MSRTTMTDPNMHLSRRNGAQRSVTTAGGRRRLASTLAIGAMALLVSGELSAQVQQACPSLVADPCTANDLEPSAISATTSDYCASPTDTFTVDITNNFFRQGGGTRYDPAIWVTVEPGVDPQDPMNQCSSNLINPDGSDEDGDACNDVPGPADFDTTHTYEISCAWDDQPLGMLFTWTQQDAFACPSPTAGTGSKCLLDASNIIIDVPRCGDGNVDDQHGEQCDDGGNEDGDGCSATCQIEVGPSSSITVVKETTEGDGTFGFITDLPGGDFSITTSGGSEQHGPVTVDPGTYSIAEDVPNGWVLDQSSCDNGNDPGSVTLAAGDTVTCTFVDSPVAPERGSINIVKNTNGGNGSFSYSGDLGAFDISTSGGTGNHAEANLAAGTYDVTEAVPAGWQLDSVSCSDGSSTDAGAATASIDLAAGESVTCTFINSLIPPDAGSITIVKQSGANDGTFPYGGDLGDFGLTTSGGTDSQTFNGLAAGVYDVTEAVPDGWTLAGLQCDDGSNVDVGNATAHIDLAAGEDVTCTFTNRLIPPPPGTVTIVKVSLGDDRQFNFTGAFDAFGITTVDGSGSRVFEELSPGAYEVTEIAPNGWKLDSIECSDGSTVDVAAGTAHIELAQGEGVMCTFTNSRIVQPDNAAITIVKQTLGGNGKFGYSGDLQTFEITTADSNGSKVFDNLAAGTFNVKEAAAKGWTLKSISCSNQSSTGDTSTATAAVVVTAQEQVTCTFVNQVVEPVPSLPRTAFFGLLALLASVTMWTLRRMHG